MNGPLWMLIAFVGCMLIGVPIPWSAGVATIIDRHRQRVRGRAWVIEVAHVRGRVEEGVDGR